MEAFEIFPTMEPKNGDFQTREYWDQRYASEAPDADFDWFRKVRCRANAV